MKAKQQNKTHFKLGIVGKLLGVLLPIISIGIAMILLFTYSSSSKIVLEKSETILKTTTDKVVNETKAWMNETLTALSVERDTLQYFTLNQDEELDYIKHTADKYASFPAGLYIATTDGELTHASFIPNEDFNIFEKPWYQDGLHSDEFIFGSVYFDEDSQAYVVGASGKLTDASGNIRGVAAADVYLDAISDIVHDVQIEKTGGLFLVDTRTNMIIGHSDTELLGIELSQRPDTMYEYVDEKLKGGETGLMTYQSSSNDTLYIDIEEVPDSDWMAISYVPDSEVMSDLNVLTTNMTLIAVISIIVVLFFILFLVKYTIGKPLKEIDYVARQIADGKLDESIQYQSNDEFGMLAFHFNKTVSRLRDYINYIDEIANILNEIAKGNLDYQLTYNYIGEFSKIKDSLERISEFLNNAIGEIHQAALEVTTGSNQVSVGAQTLSQGATEQASAIEELAATLAEVTNQTEQNAQNAQNAQDISEKISLEILESNTKMQNMTQAIRDISSKSSEINAIINTIEDISFQTNILALNAAVEAARAGAAGKGFSVVADEVRNLAGKSSEAAQYIAELIEETIHAVDNGTEIAQDAADSLLRVVENSKAITTIVGTISDASKKQAGSTNEIMTGVDQISSVVQTTSATAEQSAAASEELSSQAQVLSSLVDRFHLKEQL